MTSLRRSKRLKTGTVGTGLQIFREDESPNLSSLYEGDVGEMVLSYASISDLCKLETLSSTFRDLLTLTLKGQGTWEKVSKERFGMKNGKESCKLGTSFFRKPVFIHISRAPNDEHDMHYAGSPHVASNKSIIAVETDDAVDDGAPVGIGLYDARSLNYIGSVQGGRGWGITICGPLGDEALVTNGSNTLNVIQNANSLRTAVLDDYANSSHERIFANNRADGIPSIGCETHLIAVVGNTMYLFRLIDEAYLLRSVRKSVVLGRECEDQNEDFDNEISWGEDRSHVVVYHSLINYEDLTMSGTCEISVWRFDAESDNIFLTQTVEAGTNLTGVALAEHFIMGASIDRKIHVWDRHTKEKLYVLCDMEEEDDQLAEHDCVSPILISCHGHILVTTSHIGCALCVWDISKGQLLKRHNEAEKEHRVDMLSDNGGTDATDMAYLEHLNGFLCISGYLNIWTFPTNQSQLDSSLSICRREEGMRENATR